MSLPPLRTVTLACGRTASYRRAGPEGAPLVVLLHGAGIDRSAFSWRPLLGRQAALDLLAPNWPGDEGSTPFGRRHDTSDAGAWAMAFLDAVGVRRASFVGVSMGGGAALWAAHAHPERVARVVGVGTYGVQPRAPLHPLAYLATRLPLVRTGFWLMKRSRWACRLALAGVFGDPSLTDAAMAEEVRRGLAGGSEGRVFARYLRAEIGPWRLRTDLTPRLGEVRAPTLFVHGAADRVVPLCHVRRAAARMPDAEVLALDAGHLLTREAPGPLWRAAREFLARPSPDDTPARGLG